MLLSSLYRYPLKSGAAEAIGEAHNDELGLIGDRRWMVVDAATGKFLTQRVLPNMALLKATWSGEDSLRLDAPGMQSISIARPELSAERGVVIWREAVRALDAGDEAGRWLTRLLQRPCRLVYLPTEYGIQVDPAFAEIGDRTAFSDGFPFLLVGQASLDDLSRRVGRPMDMRRFRPNLVVSGADAYAEDGWRRIRIGDLEFRVVKPCSRCVITTIDPLTAERSPDREPFTTMTTYRKGEGGVFFGQNLIPESTGYLKVGMTVEVLE